MQKRTPVEFLVLEPSLAEFSLHAAQLLLLLLYFLVEVGVLILQKIQLRQQLPHLDPVFLP